MIPRILVFAYSDVGHACLSALLARRENVVAVYTHEDSTRESIWFPSVRQLAVNHSIPVSTEEKIGTQREMAVFKSLKPDLIFSFYYRNLIPEDVLSLASLGAYNMHGSLLPRYRGRAPVNWAVLNGETETGATLHVMEKKADSGDIVDQQAVPIADRDSAADVQSKVTKAAVLVLERQLEKLKAGTASRTPQDHSRATTFGRRRPEDGRIDWSWPARRIHNLVRAVSRPYPGAFGELHGEKVWIWKTELEPREDKGLIVTCGDGNKLEIVRLQPENHSEISGFEFKRKLANAGRNEK